MPGGTDAAVVLRGAAALLAGKHGAALVAVRFRLPHQVTNS